MSASSNAGSSSFQMPSHRSAFHQTPPRAPHHPTCRCPQCYLRSTLFPRNERGIILLPRPSSLHSSDSTNAITSPVSRRGPGGIRLADSKAKGKGKEIASPRPRSQSLKHLESTAQPSSPGWYGPSLAGSQETTNVAHDMGPSSPTSANPSDSTGSLRLPQMQSPNAAGPSQPRFQSSTVSETESTPRIPPYPHPYNDPPARTTGKRKLSECFDPAEHVLDFRNPPPPQGREPLRGFPRQRISKAEPSYSRQGTPDYHYHHAQSYRSHVPKSASPRSMLNRDRNVEIASVASRPRSYSEIGPTSSSAAPGPSHKPRPSLSSEGRQRRRSPLTEGSMGKHGDPNTRHPTMIRFSALSQNPQPGMAPAASQKSDPDTSPATAQATTTTTRTTAGGTEDTSSPLSRGDDDNYDEDYDASTSTKEASQGHLHHYQLDHLPPSESPSAALQTRLQTNPIRFREPLTAGSRQDRRVVKGGITVIQVKWDSDRKRRQGYFAPDAGSEKSKFRHYSKDDCCFDE